MNNRTTRVGGGAALLTVAIAWALSPWPQALSAEQPLGEEKLRGVVGPSKQVVLKAPMDGLLAVVEYEDNQPVKAGAVVFRIDNRLQEAVVAVSTLEVRAKELALAEAEVQLERLTSLKQTDAAKDWEVRRMRVGRDAADVARQQAAANLELETRKLARYEVHAPFDGVMIRQAVQPGASLRQGDEVLSIFAIDTLEAKMYLPVELYGKLQVGQNYTLAAAAPVNANVPARLKTIEPVIDSASQTFRCTFTIDNPDRAIPAGFTARLVWPPSPASR